MQTKKLLIILILVATSLYVSLPTSLPVKFSFYKYNVNYVLTRPSLNIRIGSFAFFRSLEVKLGLDLAGGSSLTFEADTSKLIPEDRKEAVDASRDAIERRINLFGVSEAVVRTSKEGDSHKIIVELPGITDTESAISLISQTAQLDFREYTPEKEATPSGLITYQNTISTGFTGSDFKRAKPDFDPQTGNPIIAFETKPESAKKFAEITTRLQNKPLAIFLDQTGISAPIVQNPITNGQGIITGGFTLDEVKSIAKLLNSGALPVSLKRIEQRTTPPTLGAESVKASITAGLVGLVMVILFMTLYYGRLGFIASFALIVYGLLTFAVYKLIPIVLTLPGVAGFILSVGMAVDSNILVFERMKEELRVGKPWLDSMESAFGRAWDSIRDANVATLLTAFILFNPLILSFLHTSGPIRGFAVTLLLGVVISLFTGLFVTRTLLRVFAKKQT